MTGQGDTALSSAAPSSTGVSSGIATMCESGDTSEISWKTLSITGSVVSVTMPVTPA
jgi:hypothetical protein